MAFHHEHLGSVSTLHSCVPTSYSAYGSYMVHMGLGGVHDSNVVVSGQGSCDVGYKYTEHKI